MRDLTLLEARLDLFDGDGGAAAAGDQAAQPGQADQADQPDQGKDKGKDQDQARRQAYRAMMDGEYKDLYAEDSRRIMDGALQLGRSEADSLREQLAQYRKVTGPLLQRYRIEDGDLEKLSAAIERDDAYWSNAAEEAGLSVEQYKHISRLEQLYQTRLRDSQEAENRRLAQQRLEKWDAEAAEAMKAYPDFDLSAEARNPQFLSLLRSGVPVKLAYEVLHMDAIRTIISGEAEKRVTDSIRAKGARPPENGASGQSGFTVREDLSKLPVEEQRRLFEESLRG